MRAISRVASSECPPSSKKSSSTPDPLDAEHLGPDRRQRLLGRGCAARGVRAASGARSGAGSARRSSLPFGVSGSALQQHERRRHHVLGQRSRAGAPRSDAGVGARAVGAPPRRPPAACRRARPRARPRPPRARRDARGSAASISPSSMRKPRSFTWGRRGPRNSSSPSGRQRARSPVRYSRRPARPRTGPGRSAPRSAPAGPGSRAPARRPPMYSSPATPDRHRLQAASST